MKRLVCSAMLMLLAGMHPVYAQPKEISIASLGEHPQLAEIVDGLKASMGDRGFQEGTDIVYKFSHVNWDRNLVPQMLAKITSEKPAAIVVITTPVGQAAVRAITDPTIPIVFAGIQDPVAAGVIPAWGQPTERITGASNLSNMDSTLGFIKIVMPEVKRLGVPHNPGDDADGALLERLVEAAPKHGIELVQVGVDNMNDLPQRISTFNGRVDAVYILPSNLLQPATSQIAGMLRRMNLPGFSGTSAPVLNNELLGSYAADFYQVGIMAAGVLEQVLEGKPIIEIPPVLPGPEDHRAVLSASEMERHNVSLPDELSDCDCVVE